MSSLASSHWDAFLDTVCKFPFARLKEIAVAVTPLVQRLANNVVLPLDMGESLLELPVAPDDHRTRLVVRVMGVCDLRSTILEALPRAARGLLCSTSKGVLHVLVAHYTSVQALDLHKTLVNNSWIRCIFARTSSIQKINISNCPVLTEDSLHTIASRCSHIRVLNVSSSPWLTDEGVKLVACSCASLEELNIVDCPLVTEGG